MQYLLNSLLRASHNDEDGQGIYIGGGTILIIVLIILLILLL